MTPTQESQTFFRFFGSSLGEMKWPRASEFFVVAKRLINMFLARAGEEEDIGEYLMVNV